jgi:hypothetical protein
MAPMAPKGAAACLPGTCLDCQRRLQSVGLSLNLTKKDACSEDALCFWGVHCKFPWGCFCHRLGTPSRIEANCSTCPEIFIFREPVENYTHTRTSIK